MSFRLRVLGLAVLVAVIATSVTAWLALQQANRQVTQSADTVRADRDAITEQLTEYGRHHGTWEGVASRVGELHAQTGQRIQLITDYGEVVVDTDTLAGEPARRVDSQPISINPRPSLRLPEHSTDLSALGEITLGEIDRYRSDILVAACLTRGGAAMAATDGRYGVPHLGPDPAQPLPADLSLAECDAFATLEGPDQVGDQAVVQRCLDAEELSALPLLPERSSQAESVRTTAVTHCLSQAFAGRISEVAPVPLLLYLGTVDDEDPLSAAPVLAGAGLVAALATVGSLLLSRRVLRPIKALTHASHRVAEGDLSERVPVMGRDELADLARSFNRMADSLQQAESRQRRLIADVAHELRTPLANLRGYLEALKDGVVSPGPALFASLHEESVLQQRIVDDLQDLALAEAGALAYYRTQVDLVELLETCRTAQQAVAEAAGVGLTADAGEPVHLHADPDRLRQVLGNLIRNALRATPAGGSVTLTAARAGRWAVVTVVDTGVGIAPEHLPHLFDRFWRADAARARATGGSGLGLAIVRQIVTDHAGTIEVESQLGVGSTFTIRLPVDPVDPAG